MCERCEELTEEVRQLRAELYGLAWEPPCEIKLTRSQLAVLRVMLNRDSPASVTTLYEATRYALSGYGPGHEAFDPIIKVRICELRKILKPFGLEIETVRWATGYRLAPASRVRLLNWTSLARAA